MMNRFEPNSYGRNDFNAGGDFGLFGNYGASSLSLPPSGVPAPFSGGPPPPSLMSLASGPPLLPPPPNASMPLSAQANLPPPPAIMQPPAHLHSQASQGVLAGSAGMSSAGVNTNSRHPMAVKARVFVGNLNTNAVSRDEFEQLFRRFGEVMAVSMHRGYGFIQYQHEYEARNAISFTDGMLLGGQRLDVNLASEPKVGREAKATKRQAETNVSEVTTKRPRPSAEGKTQPAGGPKPLFGTPKSATSTANVSVTTSSSGSPLKTTPSKATAVLATKSALSSASAVKKIEPAAKQPNSTATASKPAAATPVRTAVNGSDTGPVACVPAPGATECSPDILICGQCRSLFGTLAAFSEHRKGNGSCVVPVVENRTASDSTNVKAAATKTSDEPESLVCGFCQKQYDRSWDLVVHVTKDHNINLYQTGKTAVETGKDEAAADGQKDVDASSDAPKASVKKEDDEAKNN